jgi:hypothetical protein
VARRQITDRSSPAEVAQAAQELRSAQRELQQWVESRRIDPSTPREIFEGVDYGPLITAVDIERQSRIIAAQYDYVDYGDLTNANPGITIGGEGFYVPGFGSNPNSVDFRRAVNRLFASDDATVPTPQPSEPRTSFPPADNRAINNRFPPANVSSRLEQVSSDDPRIDRVERFPTRPVPRPDGIRIEPENGTRISNSRPALPVTRNNDDSGSVSGTGVESGIPNISSATNGGRSSADIVDPGRANSIPSSAAETDAPAIPSVVNAEEVDVSSLSQPRQGAGNGLYEINPADLEIRQNVLHNYVNWTYNIGLYMLEPRSFMSIVENGGVTNSGTELKNLLFRSGGAGRKGILGERKDYYIDNFRFTSVVGQNSQGARSSNNFDIAFDIYEPYGVAFLAELVQLAYSKGIEDHFEVPYLIEIKFNGYDSAGNPIPNIPGSGPKYIPIKIIDIKFNITSAATVYHVTAVPYAHIPLQDQHDAFIRDSISLSGENFEELIARLSEHLNQAEINKAAQENREPDTYEFIIQDEELRNSRVGFTHATEGGVVDVARQGMNGETDETVQINANSTIKSTIQAIAGATDFGARFNTTGQPESEQGNENRPYRLIKVIPVITDLGNYNTSTMRYRKNIVYRIETQRMYGFITPGMPGAGAQQRGWQKEYNWIFTGKNQDIVDFQAEYNIQYFQIRNSFVDQKSRVTGTLSNSSQPLQNRNLTRTEAGGNTYNPASRTASQPITDQVYNSYRGPGHQQASDNMDNVLNNPGADMITVDLQIIGDPDWIPQDRSILPQGTSTSGNARIINGSLAVDTHDNFVMLKFKTPRDYSPEKGLMQIDTEQTFIQGLYRVITLESTFTAGKFEQKLKMVRVQNQVSNDAANIPPLTAINTEDSSSANIAIDPDRRFGIFNPNGTVQGAGQSARPGPRLTPRPSASVVVGSQINDTDNDVEIGIITGEFPPEAYQPPVARTPNNRTNAIDDLSNNVDFTFDQFGGP